MSTPCVTCTPSLTCARKKFQLKSEYGHMQSITICRVETRRVLEKAFLHNDAKFSRRGLDGCFHAGILFRTLEAGRISRCHSHKGKWLGTTGSLPSPPLTILIDFVTLFTCCNKSVFVSLILIHCVTFATATTPTNTNEAKKKNNYFFEFRRLTNGTKPGKK